MFPQKITASTPHSPGIYMMLDQKSAVLYVGKAKDLCKRLSSYARHSGAKHNKTSVMLAKVKSVKTIITRTEKEALILEASLIKKHKPKYNIILRDDKNYPLIKVTVQEEWPRVMMTRRRKRDGARYFGPYSSSSAMWSTLKLISAAFPLRKCKGAVGRERNRPCLNHQMGKCLAPCVDQSGNEEYLEQVKNVILLLEGQSKTILKKISGQMQQAADNLLFERAAQLRDQMTAISKTLEKQLVVSQKNKNQDVFALCRKNAAVGIAIMLIRGGMISGSRSFFLKDSFGSDQAILYQVINQYYNQHTNLPPKEILTPFAPDSCGLLEEKLSDLIQSKVIISTAQRGDRLKLVKMALENAKNIFDEKEKQQASWQALAAAAMKKLNLTRSPETIECLDISNISGQNAVGSLVCFYQGEPHKGRYRHYRIKTIDGPNDYGMMEEVLYRRLSKGMEQENLPDLFVVDGGKGQLNVAIQIALELGIAEKMDWLGIAKERDGEGEKLYKPGRKNPVLLRPHDPVLLYLMRIRDESHRYGITFHRKLRNKNSLTSVLDEIPGIGAERKKVLLKHFGSLKRIKLATEAELTKAPGIGKELAGEIHRHLQKRQAS